MNVTPQDLVKMSERETYRLRLDANTEYEKWRDKKGEPHAPEFLQGILNVTVPNWIHFITGIEKQQPVTINNYRSNPKIQRTHHSLEDKSRACLSCL